MELEIVRAAQVEKIDSELANVSSMLETNSAEDSGPSALDESVVSEIILDRVPLSIVLLATEVVDGIEEELKKLADSSIVSRLVELTSKTGLREPLPVIAEELEFGISAVEEVILSIIDNPAADRVVELELYGCKVPA